MSREWWAVHVQFRVVSFPLSLSRRLFSLIFLNVLPETENLLKQTRQRFDNESESEKQDIKNMDEGGSEREERRRTKSPSNMIGVSCTEEFIHSKNNSEKTKKR